MGAATGAPLRRGARSGGVEPLPMPLGRCSQLGVRCGTRRGPSPKSENLGVWRRSVAQVASLTV